MKASELRDKSAEELQQSLIGLLKDQFTYGMQQSTAQLTQTHLLKAVAQDIARVKTVQTEKSKVSE